MKKIYIILGISIISSAILTIAYYLKINEIRIVDTNNMMIYNKDITFNIDYTTKQNEYGIIYGYLYVKEHPNYFNNRLFLIDENNKAYILHTINVDYNEESDITIDNVNKGRYGIASYFIYEKIPKGNYRIGVMITTPDNNIYKVISDFQMEI